MTDLTSLFGAIALILLGGLFAAIDAAISTVSVARVEELIRAERPGALRLARVMAERPRYINLVVLLRIACEAAATVLLVAFLWDDLGLKWGLVVAALIMTIASFVVIGVGPQNVGPAEGLHHRPGVSRSAACDFGAAGADHAPADPAR